MNLTVGRVVLGDVDVSWGMAGSTLTVSGSTKMLAAGAHRVLRRQMLGYVDNPDETFVPVVSDVEPDVNGFYRVTGVSVDGEGYEAFTGSTRWSVQLERVLSARFPMIELTSTMAVRPGAPSAVPPFDPDGVTRVGLPGSAIYVRSTKATATFTPTWTPTVRADTVDLTASLGDATGTTRHLYFVDPATFYLGGVLLKHQSETYVGRGAASNADWEISSGSVEVKVLSSTTKLEAQIRFRVSGTWGAWRTYRFTEQGTNLIPESVVVLRNSPECVSIRITGRGFTSGETTVTLTVRRSGEPVVYVRMFAGVSPRIVTAAATGGTVQYSGKGHTDGTVQVVSTTAMLTPAGYYEPSTGQRWDLAIGGNGTAWRNFETIASERQSVILP